jgi:hypothetical protein
MTGWGQASWRVALVGAVSVGCVARTEPKQQPTIVPDAVPTAVSIVDSRLRRAWPDDPDGPAAFTSAGYQLYARRPGQFVAVRAPTVGAVDDVVVSATFRKIGGPPGGGYGLIVRDRRSSLGDGFDQSGEYLVAGVGDRGEVGIWRRDGERWMDIIPWTASPSVRQGSEPNELRVEVVGSYLRFDVNGTRVASVTTPLRTGRVGLFVGGDLNKVLVDRMVVEPMASAVQTDLAAKEQELSAAQARIAALSARMRLGPDVRWRDEVDGVRSVFQQVARDLGSDYAASDASRVQRVTAMLGELEQEVVGIFDGFRDGIDTPHSPLNNRQALETAAGRLDSASRKAEQIRSEVQALRTEMAGSSR